MQHLRQRASDGYPVGADKILRDAYGPIPNGTEYQHGTLGKAVPTTVYGWAWSATFNRWTALVTFADGWHGYTYPIGA